ncbi:hypothetical protein CONCODRAFT_8994 [Conidiobolus coronatus NRRL 28638]|uniref:Uncharacterized protein n=1 Tax=Conidiobolus coronatus (strain ATCC 28846 / CBS 209.66 / NRRL 28638) TaxID=796925 RepID=A0A137P0R3_CONC2|nr:hypothetical protein CONCODRAFT_8994 [Conidiobolus coronatus NRRL 28638]|eukprot:KXN68670.1 hypothetical protein CONCODRAFT_8994 [Conidiobolus coronatus NRRL 28638]
MKAALVSTKTDEMYEIKTNDTIISECYDSLVNNVEPNTTLKVKPSIRVLSPFNSTRCFHKNMFKIDMLEISIEARLLLKENNRGVKKLRSYKEDKKASAPLHLSNHVDSSLTYRIFWTTCSSSAKRGKGQVLYTQEEFDEFILDKNIIGHSTDILYHSNPKSSKTSNSRKKVQKTQGQPKARVKIEVEEIDEKKILRNLKLIVIGV